MPNAIVAAPAANSSATAAAAACQAAARRGVTPPVSFRANGSRLTRSEATYARMIVSARPGPETPAGPASRMASTGTSTTSASRSTRTALTVTSSGSPGPTPTPISRFMG